MDSFSANSNSNQIFSIGNTYQVNFSNVNIPSTNYNSTTSIYTVPINGNYLISVIVGIDYIFDNNLAQSLVSINLMQDSNILQTSTMTILQNIDYYTLLSHDKLIINYYGTLTNGSSIYVNFNSGALLLTNGIFTQLNSSSLDTSISLIQIS